jgi:steroid 5-alpha reductase family enzyme
MLAIIIGWCLMAFVMAALWQWQRRSGDAGIVDVAWGLGVAALATGYAVVSDGHPTRRFVVALLAILWAVRLSGYILVRVMTLPEDGRYQTMKQEWGGDAQRKLFAFFQMQALASVIFSLPMWFAVRGKEPLSGWDFAGILLWFIAIGGETIADRQLAIFRGNPGNRGMVCNIGLWRYSRHPNYFFEWLHWWSYVLLSIGASWGWLTLIGPLLMLYFILYVTGIPPTEAQALRSRGDAYREYQRTTSPFVPWFPLGRKSTVQGMNS